MMTIADTFTSLPRGSFATLLADPPWRFINQTGKVAPEHRRLHRYATMPLEEIAALPVAEIAAPSAHLYLWCPNALLPDGLAVMKAWGFAYKANIVWRKIQKDGGSDGRGSRKPDELYPIIEACSPAPYLELFARGERQGWTTWGDQAGNGNEADEDRDLHKPQPGQGQIHQLSLFEEWDDILNGGAS
jgi:N6-adenosine-specific RNA methylase IME4